MAGALVRGILAEYAPLTGNLPVLREGDAEMRWSPAECLDGAKRELAELASSPIRQEPFGAVAKLISILTQMKRGRMPDGIVTPGGVKYSWRFKFRTRDHTWIVGQIYRTAPPPGPGTRLAPLGLPPESKSGANDRYWDSPFSAWFGTETLRCRVKEQRA